MFFITLEWVLSAFFYLFFLAPIYMHILKAPLSVSVIVETSCFLLMAAAAAAALLQLSRDSLNVNFSLPLVRREQRSAAYSSQQQRWRSIMLD